MGDKKKQQTSDGTPTPPVRTGPAVLPPRMGQMWTPGPIKILIVDDEKQITETLRRYFSFEGYVVEVANDPYTALRMVHKDNFLVVISDISMPGMTGVELLSRIKAYNGMIQVIMITGYVTLENILSCLSLGADDCFLKPLDDMDQLKRAVEEAIRKLQKWCDLMQDISRGRVRGNGGDDD